MLVPAVRALGPLPRLLVAFGNALTPGRGSGKEGPAESEEDLRGLWAQACSARAGSAAPMPTLDPTFPTGYEDFLRALGDAAARQHWTSMRLLRVGDDVILRYGTRTDRKEMVLTAHDVEAILNYAFNQRGKGLTS